MNLASAGALVPGLLINDTRVDLHHGCSRVVRAIHAMAREQGIEIVHAIPAHKDWRRDPVHLKAFERARVVIVNGEGSIHHDRPAARWLLEAAGHARSLGVPAALINTSWQANGDAFVELLRGFDIISARDARSAAEIAAAGIECRVVPDLSIFFETPGDGERRDVGFTDAVVRSVVADLESLRRRCRGRTTAIQYSPGGLSGGYRFLRGYVGLADLARPRALMLSLRSRLNQLRSQFTDDEAFMDHVASLRLLVTGRFHAAAFALAARTPLLMVKPPVGATQTDGHKLVGLQEAAGLGPWRLVATTDIDVSLLREAARWHGDERERLDAFLQASRQRMRGLFTDIRELA